MSFIVRNTLSPSVARWSSFSKMYRTFDLLWEIDEENPTLYKKNYHFFLNNFIESTRLKRFLNAMGIGYEGFVTQKVDKEIRKLWWYLDGKYEWDGSYAGDTKIKSTSETTQLVAPTGQELADMFNDTFDGKTIHVTIKYGGNTQRYINEHSLEWEIENMGSEENELGWIVNENGEIENTSTDEINSGSAITTNGLNTEHIRTVLESDPWYYLANSPHMGYKSNTYSFQEYDGAIYNVPKNTGHKRTSRLLGTSNVYVNIEGYEEPPGEEEPPPYYLGIFAMMLNNGIFEEIPNSLKDEQISTFSKGKDGENVEYKYTKSFTFKGASSSSTVIKEILLWYSTRTTFRLSSRPVYGSPGEYKQNLKYHTKDTSYKQVLDSLVKYVDPDTGEVLNEVTNSLFYNGQLRREPARRMRRADFAAMLASSLQVGQKAKKASFFERLMAFVIVLLAIVIGVATGQIYGIQIALAATSTALGVGGFLLYTIGGASTQGLVKVIGTIATIVGISAMISGIYTAIQNAGKMAVHQAASASATEASLAKEFANRTFIDNLGSYLQQSLSSVTTKITEFTTMTFTQQVNFVSDSIDTILQGLSHYQDKESEELAKDYEEYKKAEEEFNAETLSNATKHPAEVYLMTEDRITSYDAISELDRVMKSKIGGDENYSIWNSNVNSV